MVIIWICGALWNVCGRGHNLFPDIYCLLLASFGTSIHDTKQAYSVLFLLSLVSWQMGSSNKVDEPIIVNLRRFGFLWGAINVVKNTMI